MKRKTEPRPGLGVRNNISSPSLHLAVVYRRVETLKLDPANPRLHSKKQTRQIASSIATFGFNVPILIDREDNVIAGNGRLLACRELGWSEVPTLCLDHLTAAQARAFMIADNRLTEIAIWDDRLLAEQLRDLSLSGLDFDLEVTGFEMGEIDLRIASLEDTPAEDADPAEMLLEVAAGPPVSKIGDLWFLGRNRLLCSSALDIGPFTTLMGEERAAMSLPTRLTMCRSTVMRAVSARSTTAPSRWPRVRWTRPNSPLFSVRLCGNWPPSVQLGRCTTSAWTGAISKSCWPPVPEPMAN